MRKLKGELSLSICFSATSWRRKMDKKKEDQNKQKNQSDSLGKKMRIRQEDIELFKTSLLSDMGIPKRRFMSDNV